MTMDSARAYNSVGNEGITANLPKEVSTSQTRKNKEIIVNVASQIHQNSELINIKVPKSGRNKN